MTKDNALEWLERERFNQWRLERADDNEKVGDYTSKEASIEEGRQRLIDVLELLEPGKYRLKAYIGHGSQASQNAFRFEISRPGAATTTPTNTKMDNAQLQELFDKAKSNALDQFRREQFEKDTEKRFDALEKEIKELKLIIKELNDDDPENDESALEKLSGFASKIPDFKNGFDSMKGMFS